MRILLICHASLSPTLIEVVFIMKFSVFSIQLNPHFCPVPPETLGKFGLIRSEDYSRLCLLRLSCKGGFGGVGVIAPIWGI